MDLLSIALDIILLQWYGLGYPEVNISVVDISRDNWQTILVDPDFLHFPVNRIHTSEFSTEQFHIWI